MRRTPVISLLAALLFCVSLLVVGCESTDGGSSQITTAYYGVGFYDPWYYGSYDDDVVVVRPPPDGSIGAHPEHPIARPPPASVAPRPMPSIPSMPRGGFRR